MEEAILAEIRKTGEVLVSKLDDVCDSVGTKLDGIKTKLGAADDGVGAKLDRINTNLDTVSDRLGGIDEGLSGIEVALGVIRKKLESPEARAWLKSRKVSHVSQLTPEQRQEFFRFLREGLRLVD